MAVSRLTPIDRLVSGSPQGQPEEQGDSREQGLPESDSAGVSVPEQVSVACSEIGAPQQRCPRSR
jgi:hypothetical protein